MVVLHVCVPSGSNSLHLDPSIDQAPGLDLADLRDRFEIFEALHHTRTIDSPMSSDDLDAVVDLLDPQDGETVIDLACGHGELLRRLRASSDVSGIGVDLSPWMLDTAHRITTEQNLTGLSWRLDDAADYVRGRPSSSQGASIATCLGGSWIWHGIAGTLRTLASLTTATGRVALGDMHLRDGLDPAAVSKTHGAVDSVPEIEHRLADQGFDILGRVSTSDAAWDSYLNETTQAVLAWSELHPGDRSQSFVEEQQQWQLDHARDREILTWSVWVARKR